MKTTNKNANGNNQPAKTGKQGQANQPKQSRNVNAGKKGTYVKDMPTIENDRPGVV